MNAALIPRIAFVNTHPIQYFAPLYAYLNQTGNFAVTALYLSNFSVRGSLDREFGEVVKWDIDLLSGYNARFVKGAERRPQSGNFFSVIAPQIWHEVERGKFDALIVHGHTPAAVLIAVAAARHAGVPVFCRAETHLGLNRSALKRILRKPLMGAFYRFVNGVLAIGSANAAFYRAMGVPKERIFFMPYTIDNARFMAGARMSPDQRREIRAALGVEDDAPIVLYAAKLQARKHPDDLIRAALHLREWDVPCHVVIVGSGEMADELTQAVAYYKLENVHFRGFVNQKFLPQVYGAADVFVLPSEDESWGLTINEAMCAGLPVVVSKGVGCVPDLVRENVNGRTFAPRDILGLAAALHSVLVDVDARRRMGAASRDIISRWSYAESASGLQQALSSIGIKPNPQLNPVHP